MPEEIGIVHVYPELLGTYGDRGNALALVHRAAGRGVVGRIIDVGIDEPLPSHGDIYLLGGGEDSAQLLAARSLLADHRAGTVLGSRPCLAVCAGLQLLAHRFDDAKGCSHRGLGLLDVSCRRLSRRAVGEVVAEPQDLPGVPTLTGFENHGGTAVCGPESRPLARIVTGVGNGDHRSEGAIQGNIVATYLHGPVLIRNPALADLLLSRFGRPACLRRRGRGTSPRRATRRGRPASPSHRTSPVFTTARHLVIDAYRARDARPIRNIGATRSTPPSPMTAWTPRSMRVLLTDALHALSAEHRSVLFDCYYRGQYRGPDRRQPVGSLRAPSGPGSITPSGPCAWPYRDVGEQAMTCSMDDLARRLRAPRARARANPRLTCMHLSGCRACRRRSQQPRLHRFAAVALLTTQDIERIEELGHADNLTIEEVPRRRPRRRPRSTCWTHSRRSQRRPRRILLAVAAAVLVASSGLGAARVLQQDDPSPSPAVDPGGRPRTLTSPPP